MNHETETSATTLASNCREKEAADTPRTDACPKCNGNRLPFKEGDGRVIYYTCGSYGVPEARFRQSELCYSYDELAASKAEVERLRSQLSRAIEIQDEMCTGCSCYHCDDLRMELATLNPTNK